jgi:hypothetical protein
MKMGFELVLKLMEKDFQNEIWDRVYFVLYCNKERLIVQDHEYDEIDEYFGDNQGL